MPSKRKNNQKKFFGAQKASPKVNVKRDEAKKNSQQVQILFFAKSKIGERMIFKIFFHS